MTHTYAILEVSRTAYDEIAAKLREAGYNHAFEAVREVNRAGRPATIVIDMHGIAIRAIPE